MIGSVGDVPEILNPYSLVFAEEYLDHDVPVTSLLNVLSAFPGTPPKHRPSRDDEDFESEGLSSAGNTLKKHLNQSVDQ